MRKADLVCLLLFFFQSEGDGLRRIKSPCPHEDSRWQLKAFIESNRDLAFLHVFITNDYCPHEDRLICPRPHRNFEHPVLVLILMLMRFKVLVLVLKGCGPVLVPSLNGEWVATAWRRCNLWKSYLGADGPYLDPAVSFYHWTPGVGSDAYFVVKMRFWVWMITLMTIYFVLGTAVSLNHNWKQVVKGHPIWIYQRVPT